MRSRSLYNGPAKCSDAGCGKEGMGQQGSILCHISGRSRVRTDDSERAGRRHRRERVERGERRRFGLALPAARRNFAVDGFEEDVTAVGGEALR
jgi:hypothetical protein